MGEKSQQIIATIAAKPCSSIFNIKTAVKKGYFQSMETIVFFDLDGIQTVTLMLGTAWSIKLCYVAIIAVNERVEVVECTYH